MTARFRESLARLALPHHLQQVPDQGHWEVNTRYKASWLRLIRERFPGPLLYLDVDAYVHTDPWPFLMGLHGDLAVHYLQGKELLSGTILLNDSPGCRLLLATWESLCRCRRGWDQRRLAEAIADQESKVIVDHLPPEYTFVFDLMRGRHGHRTPVIEHLQASRERQRPDDPRLLRRRRRLEELSEERRERRTPESLIQ